MLSHVVAERELTAVPPVEHTVEVPGRAVAGAQQTPHCLPMGSVSAFVGMVVWRSQAAHAFFRMLLSWSSSPLAG